MKSNSGSPTRKFDGPNPVNGDSKDSKEKTDDKKDSKKKDDKAAKPKAAEPPAKLSESDYQLYEALNLLKALNVLGNTVQATR